MVQTHRAAQAAKSRMDLGASDQVLSGPLRPESGRAWWHRVGPRRSARMLATKLACDTQASGTPSFCLGCLGMFYGPVWLHMDSPFFRSGTGQRFFPVTFSFMS